MHVHNRNLRNKGPVNFASKTPSLSTDLGVTTLGFVRSFQCHCKTIFVLIYQMDTSVYWILL